MKFKLFASVCVAAGLAFGLAGCGDDNAPKSGDAKTLTVGASPVPHADILRKLFKNPISERWGKQICLN